MKYPNLVKEKFCNTDIKVVIEREGLSKYGAPLESIELDLKCNYQDSAKTVLTAEKKLVKLSGAAYFNGDICKELETIPGGYVEVFGVRRKIFSATKARNPDGTVNYTKIDLE